MDAAEWAEKSTGTRIGRLLLWRVFFLEPFSEAAAGGVAAGLPEASFDVFCAVFFETFATGFVAVFFETLLVGFFVVFFETFFDVVSFCMRRAPP